MLLIILWVYVEELPAATDIFMKKYLIDKDVQSE